MYVGGRPGCCRAVQDAAEATAAAVSQAKKVLSDAGEAAQQALSQAGGVAEHVVDAGSSRDPIRFAADRREGVDAGSGWLRARLRRELVRSRAQ